ncbi:MAG: CHC2 zinc finger domain-containing protein [Clostridium sp.]|nr:MAG: CHC2 zinc finger domain-containing protein [Clostridium sp.]
MARIAEEDINNIRSNADIVSIIGSYIKLEAKGKKIIFGICPFHNDHNPSMSVSPDKQIYTCFVCGASGNVFSFVQNYENVSFIEAVKIIADKIGYNINININEK